MPPLFGLLANNITPALFPFYLLVLLVLMVFMHEQLVRKTSHCHLLFRIQQKAPCPVSRAGSLLFSGQLQDAAADGIGHGKQVVLSNEAELCLVLIRKADRQL